MSAAPSAQAPTAPRLSGEPTTRSPGATPSATRGCSAWSSRPSRSSPGGSSQLTGLGVFWFYGPVLVFAIFPLLDLAIGMDARNPPDSVIKWLEQDRYYRWCTYLYLPIQYAGWSSPAGCGPTANSRRSRASGSR